MPTNPDHVVPVVEPHDEDERRAMKETQTYVATMIDARCPGLPFVGGEVTKIAIEALTHLVGGLTAQGYRFQRQIAELEKRLNHPETRVPTP